MKPMLMLLGAAKIALGGVASAAEVDVGAPVTAENAAAVMELTRIADAIDAAVDAKDWTTARRLFAENVAVDFTGLVGGEPATISSDALVGGWASNLTEAKTSFHMRTNHRVRFDGPGKARMVSNGYAWNRLADGAQPANGGDDLWEVWGTYTHGFLLTESGWRVDAMSFSPTHQRGNVYVRDTIVE
ncbi:MAG: nuclear transport factor 2 family protein [Parvularculaceae bacterium]